MYVLYAVQDPRSDTPSYRWENPAIQLGALWADARSHRQFTSRLYGGDYAGGVGSFGVVDSADPYLLLDELGSVGLVYQALFRLGLGRDVRERPYSCHRRSHHSQRGGDDCSKSGCAGGGHLEFRTDSGALRRLLSVA